jgi:hypothetical protein
MVVEVMMLTLLHMRNLIIGELMLTSLFNFFNEGRFFFGHF